MGCDIALDCIGWLRAYGCVSGKDGGWGRVLLVGCVQKGRELSRGECVGW